MLNQVSQVSRYLLYIFLLSLLSSTLCNGEYANGLQNGDPSIIIVDQGITSGRADVNSQQTVWVKALYAYSNGTTILADDATGLCLYLNNIPMTWNPENVRWQSLVSSFGIGKQIYVVTRVTDRLFGITNIKRVLSLSFDGLDDYVEINGVNLSDKVSSLTIVMWIKLLAPLENQSKYAGLFDAKNGIRAYIGSPGGFLCLGVGEGENSSALYTLPLSWEVDKWYFLAFVVNETSLGIYRDGDLVGSKKIPSNQYCRNLTRLWIGTQAFNFLRGAVQDFTMYSYGLSHREILLLFNDMHTVELRPTVNLSSWYNVSRNYQDRILIHGAAYSDGRPLQIRWDRMEVFSSGSSNYKVSPSSSVTVYFSLRYELDGLPFTDGNVTINNLTSSFSPLESRWEVNVTQLSETTKSYYISSITDNLFNITSFKRKAPEVIVSWDSNSSQLNPISTLSSVLFILMCVFLFQSFGDALFWLLGMSRKLTRRDPIETLAYRTISGMAVVMALFYWLSKIASEFTYGVYIFIAIFEVMYGYKVIKQAKNGPKKRLERVLYEAPLRRLPQIISLSAIFLQTFLISNTISGFVGSGNGDAANHSFLAMLTIKQGKVPISYFPYYDFILGVHTGPPLILAFLVTALNIPAYKIALLFSAAISPMMSLTVYCFVNSLFDNKWLASLSTIISAFYAIIVISPVGWGGIPYLLGFAAFNAAAAFLNLFTKETPSYSSCALMALLLSMTVWSHPASFLVFLFWIPGFWSVSHISHRYLANYMNAARKRTLRQYVEHLSIVLFLFVLFNIPFFSNLYAGMVTPNQNFPRDVARELDPKSLTATSRVTFINMLQFPLLFDLAKLANVFEGMGPFFYLAAFYIATVLVLFTDNRLSYLPKRNRDEILFLIFRSLPVYLFSIVILSYIKYEPLVTGFFPSGISVYLIVLTIRVFGYLAIPLIPLTAIVAFMLYKVVSTPFIGIRISLPIMGIEIGKDNLTKEDTNKTMTKKKKIRRLSPLIILFISALSLSTYSLIHIYPRALQTNYYRDNAKGQLDRYNVLTSDDLDIMSYIQEQVPHGTFLVNFMDGGEYLSTVTQRKTIFAPIEKVLLIKNYTLLLSILAENPSNPSALPLLREFNITYIYIGAKVGSWGETPYFDSKLFLESPFFSEVTNIGKAWVFEFNDPDKQSMAK